ncbi:MYG1 family protein [Massilioclostridium coli]|uniref:MYG1 family protein n=1 Tax=Massilioclostridium coli TaxID=1870991 RepID=UPI0022E61C4B|nr:MYG1 family protein [Massilioclostridium coli]
MIKIPNQVITHAGKFHADDVFSTALLQIINPNITVTRVFSVPEDTDALIYDIGWGKFDHHQKDAEIRENGVPFAAFGLLWREFGKQVLEQGCTPEQAEQEQQRFDENFIQPLDLEDNTGCGHPLADAIGLFNPSWDSSENPDDCFVEAVQFAKTILQHKIDSIFSIYRAKLLVESALKEAQNHIVILSRFAPWRLYLVGSDAEFVVYPSQRGGYNAQTVPISNDSNISKFDFPEEWAGKPDQELKQLSGIPTLRFCHNNRFLVATETLEDAVKACLWTQKHEQPNSIEQDSIE